MHFRVPPGRHPFVGAEGVVYLHHLLGEDGPFVEFRVDVAGGGTDGEAERAAELAFEHVTSFEKTIRRVL
ncbi:hypothetical protein ABIB14_002508 [Arthrobacter sp. UYEF3]